MIMMNGADPNLPYLPKYKAKLFPNLSSKNGRLSYNSAKI
jgi:hypothetical protein